MAGRTSTVWNACALGHASTMWHQHQRCMAIAQILASLSKLKGIFMDTLQQHLCGLALFPPQKARSILATITIVTTITSESC